MKHVTSTFLILFVASSFAQNSGSDEQHRGSLVDAHIYKNAQLGMTIRLPGSWDLISGHASTAPYDPNCRGPLCGPPEIDVALQSKKPSDTLYRVFLAGYKLSPVYQDQKRYPLQKFAQIMLAGSMHGNRLVTVGSQERIALGGKPAYRQLAGRSEDNVPRAIGYVAETNGYIVLLVVASPADPTPVKAAIEGMQFSPATKESDTSR